MINLKPIKSLEDYKEAQEQLESLFNAELDSEEGNKAEILTILIEDYERKMEPIPEESDLEPQIDYVFEIVKGVSELESKGNMERCLKLGEEYGELSAEFLKLSGYKRSDLSESQIRQNILLESTDCLIMILDIMSNMGFTKREIVEMAEKQVNKWLNNIDKKWKRTLF